MHSSPAARTRKWCSGLNPYLVTGLALQILGLGVRQRYWLATIDSIASGPLIPDPRGQALHTNELIRLIEEESEVDSGADISDWGRHGRRVP